MRFYPRLTLGSLALILATHPAMSQPRGPLWERLDLNEQLQAQKRIRRQGRSFGPPSKQPIKPADPAAPSSSDPVVDPVTP